MLSMVAASDTVSFLKKNHEVQILEFCQNIQNNLFEICQTQIRSILRMHKAQLLRTLINTKEVSQLCKSLGVCGRGKYLTTITMALE